MSNKTHYKKLAIFILSPILALAVLMFSATIATAGNVISFFINSSPVMVDSHAGMMLTSIEKERFGGSLEASLRCNPGFSIVSINDAPIEQENMRYTFENITAGKQWTVVSVNEMGDTAVHHLQFTYLPLVTMLGNPGYDYSMGTIAIAEPGKALTEPMCDVNYDGAVTASDITAIYNHLLFDNTGYDVKLDTNFDGYITASDITEIYNVILGM